MSLYGAMFSGVSGLNAQSQALGMISDNISNVNTVGYKTKEAAFSALVTRSTPNFHSPGGVRSTPVASIDRQGLLQASSNITDLAISGQGFFVVTASPTPTSSDTRSFTRAGQFSADAEGYLVTPAGFYLQGWPTDSTGTPTSSDTSTVAGLQTVRVSNISGSAVPTSSLEMGVNLPASAAVSDTFTTNAQIFDSLGVGQTVTFTWTKTATNAWTVTANAANASPAAGEEGTAGSGIPFSVDIVFNSDGTPLSFDGATTPPDLALTGWTSGAGTNTIALDFGTAGAIGTARADGVTQFSSSYITNFVNQDGVQFGNFFGVNVDEFGVISALFDNGQTLKIFRTPIATFPNPNGLDAKTGTVFSETEGSGSYFLREAGESNAGLVVPSTLEASTTDLAKEFTSMIITQRAYSANTRVITTADQMLDDLLRVGR